jgi:hypothetical protein
LKWRNAAFQNAGRGRVAKARRHNVVIDYLGVIKLWHQNRRSVAIISANYLETQMQIKTARAVTELIAAVATVRVKFRGFLLVVAARARNERRLLAFAAIAVEWRIAVYW